MFGFFFFNWVSDKKAELLDLGQTEVLNKLRNYLELSAPKETNKLQLSLKSGHCHALSVCHAAMGAIGKTKWWEAALVEVAAWDGEKESLDKLILLPDADDNKPIPLKMICSKVLNYLKSYQVDSSTKDFRKSGANCVNVLSPDLKHFEILDKGNIKTIKELSKLAGYFTKEQLEQLLDAQYIEGSLCIVHSTTHVIRIGYLGNDEWLIYDPNYPHAQKNKAIHKKMSKKALIDELVRIQDNSLCIEIANLEQPKVKNRPLEEYNRMFKNGLEHLLKDFGFHQIAREAPHLIERVIKIARKNKKVANALAQALAAAPDKVLSDGKHVSILENGLQEIAVYYPKYLKKIINIAKYADNGTALISKGFEKFSDEDTNGSSLGQIAEYQTLYLSKVLNYLDQYTKEKSSKIICEAFVAHESNSILDKYTNGLMTFDTYASDYMPRMLSKIAEHPSGYEYLVTALVYEENKEVTQSDVKDKKITCFEQLVRKKSKNLTPIMEIITKDLDESKVQTLLKQSKLLMLMGIHQPDAFREVIKYLFANSSKHPLLVIKLREVLSSNLDDYGISLLLQLYKNNSKTILDLLSVISKDKSGYQFIISMLGEKNKDGETALQQILECGIKEDILPILEVITKAMEYDTHFSQNQQILVAMATLIGGLWLTSYAGTSSLLMISGVFTSFVGVAKNLMDFDEFNRLKNNYLGLNSDLKLKPNSIDDLFNRNNSSNKSAEGGANTLALASRVAKYFLTQSTQEVTLKETHIEIYGKLKDIVTLYSQKKSPKHEDHATEAVNPLSVKLT